MYFDLLKEKYITILGHDNIDVDSIISGILLSKLFTYLNIKNQFVITDKSISQDTLSILNKYKIDTSPYINKPLTEHLFLVDHNSTNTEGIVLGCIDHHPIREFKDYLFYDNRPASACAKIIYDYMEELSYPIEKDDVLLTILALYIDTCSLRSSKTLEEDIEWSKNKALEFSLPLKQLELDGLCTTDLNLPVSQLALNGLKKYNYNNNLVISSYIQINNAITYEKIIQYIMSLVKANMQIKMWVFLIIDFKNNLTIEYRISEKTIEKNIYENILSRGKNIMPNIEKLF